MRPVGIGRFTVGVGLGDAGLGDAEDDGKRGGKRGARLTPRYS